MSQEQRVNSITVSEVAENEGFFDENDNPDTAALLHHYFNEGQVPSICEYGCLVEQDGTCEHGHESIFLASGMI
jgi:hypothetical protein